MRIPALAACAALLAACQSNPPKTESAAPPAAAEQSAPKPTKAADAPTAAGKPAEAPAPVPAKKGEAYLEAGIKAYDNGDYKTAQQEMQAALDLGLSNRNDRLKAYKHLAFVACATGKPDICKAHFRRALAISSRFTLTPAEAGHPVWGPVFRQAKAEAASWKAAPPAK